VKRLALIACATLVACDAAPAPAPAEGTDASPPAPDELAPLRALEGRLRATDFAAQAPPERATGANPSDVVAVGDRLVGVLAGDDAVVALDRRGRELARLDGPRGARTIALAGDGVLVAGDAPVLHRYRLVDGALTAAGTVAVPGAAVAAMAVHASGAIYVADPTDHAVRALLPGGATVDVGVCRGASRAVATASALALSCVLDRAVLIFAVDAGGRPIGAPVRIAHDGPAWTVAAADDGAGVVVAIGGAEDHALDRSQGYFGYVDSFGYVYRVAGGVAEQLAAVNLSEHGIVMPKWMAIRRDGGSLIVNAAAYGADGMVTFAVAADGAFSVVRRSLPPGTRAAAVVGGTLVAANPLLDAWVVADDKIEVVPVAARRAAEPAPATRLGELLFFTNLMAPWGTSEGSHSRFTCETCHFEGYGDGRVHYTGRDDVHATTRALRGLAQSRPYFSRALDKTMTDMVHAEFGVANRGTGHASWFELDRSLVPWLAYVPQVPARLSPIELRAAFMQFLGVFGHEANPVVGERRAFTDAERKGAVVFRTRCEGCHQARLVVDDPATRVAFADWERDVMSPSGAITWASDSRARTGVEPYVHADGPRVPSLRRLYRKFPYFTNGSAESITDVLARARIGAGDAFAHAGEPAGMQSLSPDEQAALQAFLRLL